MAGDRSGVPPKSSIPSYSRGCRQGQNESRCERAFAYYRRVVENQKSRIIAEMKRAAERVGVTAEQLASFDAAISETQFSRAIDEVKDAIPAALMVKSHNPLTLLHNALSKGLHAKTDEECLALATSIRVVLTDLAERISAVMKNEEELNQAVSRLLKP